LFEQRWLLWLSVFAVIPAFVANEAGWVAAEVGRQPWIVYAPLITDDTGDPILDENDYYQFDESQGLRTTNAVSKMIAAEQVVGSIIMFAGIYILLFIVWVFVLHQKIKHGPDSTMGESEHRGVMAAAASLSKHEQSLTR
jgi:cytochrome d ubiquinol oxidase subunit I